MKLKNMILSIDDKLAKFNRYVDNFDFDKCIISIHIIYENDNKSINIFCEDVKSISDIKKILKYFVNKYWKEFERGINFHIYDGDFLIEIKEINKEINCCEFRIEALDESLYCTFNTNFIIEL